MDRGENVASQIPFMRQLVRDSRLKSAGVPPQLKPGEARDWKTICGVLDSVAQLLQDERFPPVRRIVHVLQLAGLLSKAKTLRLTDAQVTQLVQTLVELVPEESQPLFSDRRPPKGYSKVLFRTVAIHCARLHPQCRHISNWSARWQLVQTAWKTFTGVGSTPQIGNFFAATEFVDLEKPRGALQPEIYHPMTRYFETTSASYLYATADRQSWSIVDSLRGLAILFPVGMWLMRWASHGRQATAQDMVDIIVALDRSQGYAPLTGSLQRHRLSALASGAELERLVVWYAS